MALTVVATPKDPAANSYLTVAEADAYFEGRLHAGAWVTAQTSTKAVAVVAATSRLEQERFEGVQTTTTQRLQWPRYGVWRPDGQTTHDADTVPRPVKEAACELALALLNAGSEDLLADTGLESLDEVSVGPISVTPARSFLGGQLPANVARLLRGIRVGAGGPRLVRG